MYPLLLASRYLTSRVIPLLAVAAVALCVALVIIVVSVMTGFLEMVKESGQTLMGDVVISRDTSGIPHYPSLLERLEADPAIDAATPVVEGWGLLRMPYPDSTSKDIETIQVWGVEPTGLAAVTGFGDTIAWQQPADGARGWMVIDIATNHGAAMLDLLDPSQRVALFSTIFTRSTRRTLPNEAQVEQLVSSMTLDDFQPYLEAAAAEPEVLESIVGPETYQAILSLDPRLVDPSQLERDGLTLTRDGSPAIITGMHVSRGNERNTEGEYDVALDGYWWMPRFDVTLTMIPIDLAGGISEPSSRIMPVANEFQSGVFIVDDTRVMIPIEIAQEMLGLDRHELVDDDFNVVGIDPARATMVLVKAAPGTDPQTLKPIVESIYDEFAAAIHADETLASAPPIRGISPGLSIQTWEQQQAQFIAPVEKERELMRTLFSIIYLVCAALILAIFWAIVHEKTRDIGILRSIGASRVGIISIFLSYGLVVGVIGAVVGMGLGWVIVLNMDVIHGALANPPLALAVGIFIAAAIVAVITIVKFKTRLILPCVIGSMVTLVLGGIGSAILALRAAGGVVIWDPSVYYFSEVPTRFDLGSAIWTMAVAILFSVLGALIPAAKAADTDPVKALHNE